VIDWHLHCLEFGTWRYGKGAYGYIFWRDLSDAYHLLHLHCFSLHSIWLGSRINQESNIFIPPLSIKCESGERLKLMGFGIFWRVVGGGRVVLGKQKPQQLSSDLATKPDHEFSKHVVLEAQSRSQFCFARHDPCMGNFSTDKILRIIAPLTVSSRERGEQCMFVLVQRLK
jgi:hypothetical protein